MRAGSEGLLPAGDLEDHAMAGYVVLHAHVVRLAGRVKQPTRSLGVEIVDGQEPHAAVGL